MEEIVIDIDAHGNVQVEGNGIKGPDCETVTRDIEKALGAVREKNRKREYHEVPQVRRKVGN